MRHVWVPTESFVQQSAIWPWWHVYVTWRHARTHARTPPIKPRAPRVMQLMTGPAYEATHSSVMTTWWLTSREHAGAVIGETEQQILERWIGRHDCVASISVKCWPTWRTVEQADAAAADGGWTRSRFISTPQSICTRMIIIRKHWRRCVFLIVPCLIATHVTDEALGLRYDLPLK